jgi:RNA polymerase-binding transcription factor DksA
LSELDQALERVADGRYGTCITCGSPIGAERLAALPITELCVPCAGHRPSSLRSRRPS